MMSRIHEHVVERAVRELDREHLTLDLERYRLAEPRTHAVRVELATPPELDFHAPLYGDA